MERHFRDDKHADAQPGRLPASLLPHLATEPCGLARNRILQQIPAADRARMIAALQPVVFKTGDVVCEAGAPLEHLYFPTTAVIASLYTMEDGATVEMGLAGNDGVIGVSLFLGGDTTAHEDVAVVGGSALALKARTLRDEFAAGGVLQSQLLRYTQSLITQISQAVVCNRLHPAEQRLCRWLLMCHDRIDGDELQMTQEFISSMLGGRRETVTVAAGRLQDAGLIRCSRGQIRVLDRRGLERAACECYGTVALPRDRSQQAPIVRRVVKTSPSASSRTSRDVPW